MKNVSSKCTRKLQPLFNKIDMMNIKVDVVETKVGNLDEKK